MALIKRSSGRFSPRMSEYTCRGHRTTGREGKPRIHVVKRGHPEVTRPSRREVRE